MQGERTSARVALRSRAYASEPLAAASRGESPGVYIRPADIAAWRSRATPLLEAGLQGPWQSRLLRQPVAEGVLQWANTQHGVKSLKRLWRGCPGPHTVALDNVPDLAQPAGMAQLQIQSFHPHHRDVP